jgi:hypothetical protein
LHTAFAARYNMSIDEVIARQALVGTPSDMIKGLEQYLEGGATHFVCYFVYSDMKHLYNQMRLFKGSHAFVCLAQPDTATRSSLTSSEPPPTASRAKRHLA